MTRKFVRKPTTVCINDGADGSPYLERVYMTDCRLLEFDDNYSDTFPYDSIEGLPDVKSWHYLIENISLGWYVGSETTDQEGFVYSIIYNKYGIPVCVKVIMPSSGYYFRKEDYDTVEDYLLDCETDFISIDRISYWDEIEEGYHLDIATGVVCPDEEGVPND